MLERSIATSPPTLRRLDIWGAISLCLVCCLLYYRTTGFLYVWDDSLLFLDKDGLLNAPLSWELLSQPVLPGTSYFRPLIFLTWFIEFHIAGQSSAVSHFVNLAIFVGNVLLVFYLSLRVLDHQSDKKRTTVALLGTTVYAVHPAMIESVAWVSGRFDLLSTFFILFAAWAFSHRNLSASLKNILVGLAMLCSLFAKELGIVIPAVLYCVWMACFRQKDEPIGYATKRFFQENKLLLATCLISIGAYLVLRVESVGAVYHQSLSAEYAKIAFQQRALPARAFLFYLTQTILPFYDINPLHPASLSSVTVSEGVLLALGCGIFFVLVVTFIKHRMAAGWLLLAYFICLLPVLHFLPLTIGGNIGHERFLAAPLAFFSVAISTTAGRLETITTRKNFVLYSSLSAFLMWIALSVFTTASILPFWSSDLRLWNLAYKTNPNFDYARYNYLFATLAARRLDLTASEFESIFKKKRGLDVGEQIFYANYLIRKGDKEALQYLEGAIFALPKFHEQGLSSPPDNFLLTRLQMAGAYLDYAGAKLIFAADTSEALKYNDIATWYLKESERLVAYAQRVAILYAQGRFQEASNFEETLKTRRYQRTEMNRFLVKRMLGKFCQAHGTDTTPCPDLSEQGRLVYD